VAFEVWEVKLTCELVDFSSEFFFTQQALFATGVGPGEKVFMWGDGVDLKVIFDGSVMHQMCLVLWTWRKLADETNAKNTPKIC